MKKLLLSFIFGLFVFNSLYAQWKPLKPVYVHAADTKILESNPNR
jgi:hypothetical protein